jgi:hypothetical protein
MEKGTVLVVDDARDQADIASENIRRRRGYRTSSPLSLKDLLSAILFTTYEGVMIDVIWQEWTPSVLDDTLSKYKTIRDGIDFADFIFKLNPRLGRSIALYSSAVNLTGKGLDERIRSLPFKPKLIPTPFPIDRSETKGIMEPLLIEVEKAHRSNPLLQPTNFLDSLATDRSQAYKSITAEYSNWLDFQFDIIGDYSWALVCGPRVQTSAYGVPLNGKNASFNVGYLDKYPSTEELDQMAKRTKFFPFILWNTRKPEFVEAQFELAGDQLKNIPYSWRQFFAISVGRRCSDLYRQGYSNKVFGWCKNLDNYGKVEVAKQIHMSLRTEGESEVEGFNQESERHELPVILDVLMGRVDCFDDERKSAKVVMKSHNGEHFVECLSQARLARSNIRFVDTWFEYTVYRQPRGEVIADIQACDPEDDE